ncbi:carbohydrate-binding family 25 protein [Desulfotomaculum nigrificans CO-1-SRB]|uniref:Carbohydrate-binding family 25 protein n=1 Tax=Desulfotomaculum nigrificans (strain DSM 14880 / VKM B-2319 / CO-1-SRB) TaxID=868595 RepID=F6B7L5_DESCC|nr:carbohydrate-binding protein [Desulfotomaculum nigrificans]AEF94569.1 carbohydrate-binding family 25 protein [Desulfotomaculum nigrificans CO-1-SRB]
MANRTNFGEQSIGAYRLKEMHDAQYPGGVVVDPTPITAGEEVVVFYNGLLAQSGADEVYVHCGFGDNDQWKSVQDLRMAKTGWGWVKSMTMPDTPTRFNFCFHDSAQNWDNNNGHNWSFQVHDGQMNKH